MSYELRVFRIGKALGSVLIIMLLVALGCQKEKDTVPPVITLIGDNPLTVQLGTTFNDPGASAFDDVDGDISDKIIITGSVDMQTEGEYVRFYNVKDQAGNDAAEVQRRVKVLIF